MSLRHMVMAIGGSYTTSIVACSSVAVVLAPFALPPETFDDEG